jgi:hypothetical protein
MFDDQSFSLVNDTPRPRPLFAAPATKAAQRVLFAGLDCLPGQLDLFQTDGEAPADDQPAHAHEGGRETPPAVDELPDLDNVHALVWASPAMRIGEHDWRIIVYAHDRYHRCTQYEFRGPKSPRDRHGRWTVDERWPTYNDHDGEYAGCPRTLRRLWDRHNAAIHFHLEDRTPPSARAGEHAENNAGPNDQAPMTNDEGHDDAR